MIKKKQKHKYRVSPRLKGRYIREGIKLINSLRVDDLLAARIKYERIRNVPLMIDSDFEWLHNFLKPKIVFRLFIFIIYIVCVS